MGVVRNDDHTGVATDTNGKKLYTCDAPSCDVRRVPWGENWHVFVTTAYRQRGTIKAYKITVEEIL